MRIVKQLKNRLFPARPAKQEPLETVLDQGGAASESSAMQKASSWWGTKAMEAQQQVLHSSWAECPIIQREYIAPLLSGPARQGWLETIAMEYFSQPVDLALSLGCGSGGLERHALQLNIARNIDGLDISAEAVEIASTLAKDSGQDRHIRYAVANLNELEFKPDVYGAAFASQSVHHIESLDHYMLQVRNALKPGALFVINEFVGPNQFQWTDIQVELAQQLLDSIPEKFKTSIRGQGVKETIHRPSIEEMNAYDPTEAVCSEQIVENLEKQFTLIDRRDFGGTLLHLVLDDIAGNLSFCEEGVEIIRRLYREEARLIEENVIGSDFTLLVARKEAVAA